MLSQFNNYLHLGKIMLCNKFDYTNENSRGTRGLPKV